jgi:hypothetical protein
MRQPGQMEAYEEGEVEDIEEVIDVAVSDIQEAIFADRAASLQQSAPQRSRPQAPPTAQTADTPEAVCCEPGASIPHMRPEALAQTNTSAGMAEQQTPELDAESLRISPTSTAAMPAPPPPEPAHQEMHVAVAPHDWGSQFMPAGQAASSGNFIPFSVATALAALLFAAVRAGRETAKAERLDARRLEVVLEERLRRAAAAARARGESGAAAETRIRAAKAKVCPCMLRWAGMLTLLCRTVLLHLCDCVP